MRKKLKYIVLTLAAVFGISQLIRPDLTNPPVAADQRIEASVAVPYGIAVVLRRSCNDCHTNETRYPWYSRITPVSWWLQNHVDHGRSHLNFSQWARYTPQQKAKRLEEICEVVESKEMPLPSYTWGHSDAVLSDNDGKMLCDWARGAQVKQ